MENTLILGKKGEEGEEGDRGCDDWMASQTQGHDFNQAPEVADGQGSLVYCMGSQRVGHNRATELN